MPSGESHRGAGLWTEAARKQHTPRNERYPSDLTDAVRYVLRTGCQWRQLPKDFSPRSTVYSYFWEWMRYGVLDRIHHALLVACREAEGREASPTAAIIDTQAVKATEKGAAAGIPSATTRAKRSRESNETACRHDRIAAWRRGFPASVQDRDCAVDLIWRLQRRHSPPAWRLKGLPLKSSSARTKKAGSKSSGGAGLSSAPFPGSGQTGA
jgi:transposase